MRRGWPRLMIRYHIRSKLLLWGFGIVVFSTLASSWLSRQIGPELAALVGARNTMAFVLVFGELLIPLLFLLLASFMVMTSSKSLIDRVLDLSLAAKEIARGNFKVRVSERDRHDEVYQLARDFNRMAEELQRNEYLRKDFIHNASHEMKTPLAVISGYVDLLREGDCTPTEQAEYLAVIQREVKRLRGICQDMLEMSRLENCAILENRSEFRLDEQLRRVIVMLQNRWEAAELTLDIDLAETTICGNEGLLEQVWTNLLDNAVKFTDPGGLIRVTLRAGETKAQVIIEDNGIGMSQEVQSRIFEQFFQGEHSRAREGAGLGLPLVRRIIQLHQGHIQVTSAPGQGTAMEVTLPREKGGK